MGSTYDGPLVHYTPRKVKSAQEQAAALAIVHAEFVLIHPFGEATAAADDR
jgi:hypothetical protein